MATNSLIENNQFFDWYNSEGKEFNYIKKSCYFLLLCHTVCLSHQLIGGHPSK